MTQPQVYFSSDVEADNPLDGITIPLDDEVFRCEGRLSVLLLSKLAAKAIGDGTEDAAEAAAIYYTLSLAFGSAEYKRFETHVTTRNTPDEVVLKILQYINEQVQAGIERQTARPTRPSRNSSTGRKPRGAATVRSISLAKANLSADDDEPPAAKTVPAAARKPRTARTTGRRTG